MYLKWGEFFYFDLRSVNSDGKFESLRTTDIVNYKSYN